MIVREIKTDPEKVLATFDYYNDYKDTRSWCVVNAPELVDRLDAGDRAWLAGELKRHEKK